MAKRRQKKRTHLRADTSAAAGKPGQNRAPKSMVIRMGAGEVGSSVSQLVKDVRTMMEPDTASRLKERRGNKLKDYTHMAGPLGVTHLLLFSKSPSGHTNMRIAITPRGPTFTFRVERYSLCKDVQKAQRRPLGGAHLHHTPPLLVMNNFQTNTAAGGANDTSATKTIPKHLESLSTTVFQSLFPPINPQATPLSSIKRIMLLNREISPSSDSSDEASYTLNLRHYAISTRRTGIPKRIRRLDATDRKASKSSTHRSGLPNLGRMTDVADYLLDPAAGGYTSASETELDTDAEIEMEETVTKKVLSKKEFQRQRAAAAAAAVDENGNPTNKPIPQKTQVEKRAVKLTELGPRLHLRLVKVEDGVCEGRVMWHEFITKSASEQKEMDKIHEKRKKEKEARRKEQKENIERKKREKEEHRIRTGGKPKSEENGEGEGDEDDEDELEAAWESDDEDFDGDGDVHDDEDEEDVDMEDGGVDMDRADDDSDDSDE